MGREFDQLGGGLDVESSLDSVLCIRKRLVLNELETSAVVYQRVSGNTRFGVVGFRETTIDDHEPSACLDGILAFRGMYGHVAVDDMAVIALNTESIKNTVANLSRITLQEIVALLLFVGVLVDKEVAFEGSHLRLVEQWRVLSAPQIQEIIACEGFEVGRCVVLESGTDELSDVFQ